MLKNKNGEDVELEDALAYLQGTDELDRAASVIDFAVYPLVDGKPGDPEYYLIGTEVIVSMISFTAPFVTLELDFRNAGINLLQQVMSVIRKFHNDMNSRDLLMISTITPLSRDAEFTLTLVNPLISVRGFSDTGNASTILQLGYSAQNAIFNIYDIDFEALDAEVNRELLEMESYKVTNEALEAAESIMDDDNNEQMKSMFKPEFGMNSKQSKRQTESTRIVGNRDNDKIMTKKDERIGLTSAEDLDNVMSRKDREK